MGPILARPLPRQSNSPSRIVIKKNRPPTKVEATTASESTISKALKEVLLLDQSRRKRLRSDKVENVLGINLKELVNEVLEALSPETTSMAMVHNKYCTNA